MAPSFGLHPWWLRLENSEPLELLRQRIEACPCAGVGECGLDSLRKKEISLELQLEVLRSQLDLAKEFQRPVSLHCVGAHGALLTLLQEVFQEGHGPGLVPGNSSFWVFRNGLASSFRNVWNNLMIFE